MNIIPYHFVFNLLNSLGIIIFVFLTSEILRTQNNAILELYDKTELLERNKMRGETK